MKIFITGAAGFLGSHLADRMLELGHEVIGCDNYIGGYQDNVNHKMEFHHADCMDLAKMRELTKGCEIVYHCASTAYEGLSVFSPHFVTMNTYQITMSVLGASIDNRVRRFVYCSSMARYGFLPVVPFTEEMTPRPLDPYGIAKLASENTIVNLAKVHNFEYAIAVPHNIIGARQKYADPFRNVAAILINLMLQGRQPIIYGDGEQKRNFSFVITAPASPDAIQVELYARQFDWTARYPGEDGGLGATDVRLINGTNPLGIVTRESVAARLAELELEIAKGDSTLAHAILAETMHAELTEQVARMRRHVQRIINLRTLMEQDIAEKDVASTYMHGADDIVIKEFHLPVRQEVKVLIRSQDVIHSAYIPHLRAQMNAVPGMTTTIKMRFYYSCSLTFSSKYSYNFKQVKVSRLQ